MKLVWAPSAIGDIAQLHDFLKSKDPDAARRAAGAIRQGVRILADHPRAGRPVEELSSDFREWPIRFGSGAYVALYRLEATEIVIVAVRHSREAGYVSPLP